MKWKAPTVLFTELGSVVLKNLLKGEALAVILDIVLEMITATADKGNEGSLEGLAQSWPVRRVPQYCVTLSLSAG